MLRLCVLLIVICDSLGQVPEDFCAEAPPVLRGNHFVIETNETWFSFQRGLDVTVKPKNYNSSISEVADVFLYVPATDAHPGIMDSPTSGHWTGKQNISSQVFCPSSVWIFSSGAKSADPDYPQPNITATWYAANDGRNYVYFVAYVTPDHKDPNKRWPPKRRRRWYYTYSKRVYNLNWVRWRTLIAKYVRNNPFLRNMEL
ncbi:uncharacterized protein LOC121390132 [Gigantopelta aegis]|uniref:uncharacterized protein LOC121390132 n=1 Tax=Gigantopelta aegis TaxID=1735272 RepID=UPI001B88B32B|nr:uncharacterized protein LOC121390132 [Gigantopelta aegis]